MSDVGNAARARWPAPPAERLLTPAIVGAGAVLALLLTAATALDVRLGVAGVAALVCAGLLIVEPWVGLAALAAILFVERLPFVGLAATALALLVAARWWAERRRAAVAVTAVPAPAPALYAAVVAFLLWTTLSLTWARRSTPALDQLGLWLIAAAVFAVVATSLRDARSLIMVVRAFVAGAVLSVLVGAAVAVLTPGGPLVEQTFFEDRLQGGAGDPNFLAAGLVAAIPLAVALRSAARGPTERGLMLVALLVLVAGLGATQSRGGIVAACAVALAAVVLSRGRRGRAALAAGAVAALVVAALALAPGGLERVTTPDPEGDGRADLWRIAGRMVEDQPVLGVGVGNFPVRSGEFVREPGSLEFVDLIAEQRMDVHNAYLQALAETGILGLLLFVAVAGLALGSARTAERRLAARGDAALADVAHGLVLALVGMLTALVFISYGHDSRLWLLFALGPALLAISARWPGPGRPRA